jgi:hypothetical protein
MPVDMYTRWKTLERCIEMNKKSLIPWFTAIALVVSAASAPPQ